MFDFLIAPALWLQLEMKLLQLAWCESEFNPMAINKSEIHGASYGLYQFRLSTLYHFAERYGIERKDPLDPLFQKEVARAMILDGRGNHWACWKKMNLKYENN